MLTITKGKIIEMTLMLERKDNEFVIQMVIIKLKIIYKILVLGNILPLNLLQNYVIKFRATNKIYYKNYSNNIF